MAAEYIKVSESVKMGINAGDDDAEYEVIAERGVQINDTTYEKGERLTLPRSIARGLLRDKGIKQVAE